MMSYCSIPTHVTALYVFAAVNLTILLNLSLVEANVIARTVNNRTVWEAPDKEALFGPAIPEEGIWGHLVAQTSSCCTPKEVTPPPPHNQSVKWIALIKRGPCQFERKVYNAQTQGYDAVIIHNVGSDELERMGPGTEHLHVNICSVFIGAHDASKFKEYSMKTGYLLWINTDSTFNYWPLLKDFIIIACAAFSFGLIVGLAVLVARWVRDVRHRRRSRLSLAHLKKIPVKKFKKGDQYDVCAICLDEYEDGDKLRILPCSHAYHQKCIDPWLTKNKKFCPICKRKVIPGNDDSDSDSESDDDEGGQNENTPLLSEAANTGAATAAAVRGGGTFDQSGLPSNLRNDIYTMSYDDTSSEDSFTVSTSNYHSSVEVHQPNVDKVITVTMDNETCGSDSGDTESADSEVDDNEEVMTDHGSLGEGATGLTNPAFPIVTDHFSTVPRVGSINTADDAGSRSSLDEYRPLMEEVVVAATALPQDKPPVERDQIV